MILRNLGALALLLVAFVYPAFATTTAMASDSENSSAMMFPSGTDPVIEAGDRHACVFYPADGNVNCFGMASQYPVPYGVEQDYLAGDALDFSVGDYTNCVLKAVGTTHCWGYAAASISWDAAKVASHGKAVDVEVGYGQACVLTEWDEMHCVGQYLTGSPSTWALKASGGIEFIAASSYAACYKLNTESSTLHCFGWNVSEPTWNIKGKGGTAGTPVQRVSGHYAPCVLVADGSVDCMNNTYNEIGQTTLPRADETLNVVDQSSYFGATCAVDATGLMRCYGRPTGQAVSSTFDYAVDAISVANGSADVCYVTRQGETKCLRATPDGYNPPVADSDGDGVNDDVDAFPNDASESVDTDRDGIGNNADADDDGDGYSDQDELDNNTDPLDASSMPADNDGDGVSDMNDPDDDNDGVSDELDSDPFNPDVDGDSILDGADYCAATNLLDNVGWGQNRWRFDVSANAFVQNASKGKSSSGGAGRGNNTTYTLATTGGCTCEQIIDKLQLGEGHKKHGCSNSAMSDWAAIVAGGTAGKGMTDDFTSDLTEMPTEVTLEGNYPNPFNPQTTIRFGLPEASEVSLVVYDAMGRQVQVLVRGTLSAGTHSATFDASSLPSGAYIYRLVTPEQQFSKVMLLLK